MATCKSCGKEIQWVKMDSGKAMPVDVTPKSMVQVSGDGHDEPMGKVVRVFESHFATCPNAAQHRSPR
jgi:hypothetical protein